MGEKPRIKVLFLCTGNSCRSQMAEAILRHIADDRFRVCSAGSHPAGFVHALAVDAMTALNISMTGQRSKSWDEFADARFDVVITLCDEAAEEVCPRFPGSPLNVHWSTPDPAFAAGSNDERLAFAITIAQRLKSKLEALVEIDFGDDREKLRQRLRFLGEI